MLRLNRITLVILGIFLGLLPLAAGAQVPELSPVPAGLSPPKQEALSRLRSRLEAKWNDLSTKVANHNQGCRSVRADTSRAAECNAAMGRLQGTIGTYVQAVKNFNRMVQRAEAGRRRQAKARAEAERRKKKAGAAAEQEKAIVAFFAATAAAIEREKKAATKEPPRPSIMTAPLTPGSASPGLLSGSPEYEKKVTEYDARKSDVFRRLIEQTRLRDECRARSAACSADGKAYDEREAIRRRDRQYFLWGEASYYIRFNDLLKDPPPEMAHEIGSLGGIKAWPYGWLLGDKFYFFVKEITNYGSTRPGGEGYAKQGLQKALNDNQGLNP